MSPDATVCAGSSAGYNWIMFLFLTSAALLLHPAPAAAAGKFTAATSSQHRGQRMLELR